MIDADVLENTSRALRITHARTQGNPEGFTGPLVTTVAAAEAADACSMSKRVCLLLLLLCILDYVISLAQFPVI
jgi:hypothetical protein